MGGPHNKDDSNWGSVLGSLYLGKLSYQVFSFRLPALSSRGIVSTQLGKQHADILSHRSAKRVSVEYDSNLYSSLRSLGNASMSLQFTTQLWQRAGNLSGLPTCVSLLTLMASFTL